MQAEKPQQRKVRSYIEWEMKQALRLCENRRNIEAYSIFLTFKHIHHPYKNAYGISQENWRGAKDSQFVWSQKLNTSKTLKLTSRFYKKTQKTQKNLKKKKTPKNPTNKKNQTKNIQTYPTALKI